MSHTHSLNEPVAIIGSGCRFPGDATSTSKLWDLLLEPHDVSKKIPETRFNPDGFYHADGEHHGSTNVSKSYVLDEDPRLFDSAFFNIAPREAEAIDPQQRLLLETVYEGMESAGYSLKSLQGTHTSVYVGLMTADYTDIQARDTEYLSQYMATGTSRSLIANRISYFFDWHGPSMTVDTACSSSLTAVHLAVQGLRSGECRVACAAGANLLLGPDLFIGASSLHMISPSGKSQMWDAKADGYSRGEGIAAVFLKTLSSALADGDQIEAIIRETGVNSDGRTQGITLPSSAAQAALIEQVYIKSGLDPTKPNDRPQYFEAHGTGTQAGDPREASAISRAFFGQQDHQEPQSSQVQVDKLFVGSIKTVIGHTEGAAGIAGLLKVSLAMQHNIIPPNQHLQLLNPSVAPSYTNLHIPTTPTAWPSVTAGFPLRASVNSFGFGGTNAHAIVESYQPKIHDCGPWGNHLLEPKPSQDIEVLSPVHLMLSANSEKSLIANVEKYSDYLKLNGHVNLQDLAWTLRSRRSALPIKAIFSGLATEEIAAQMDSQLNIAQTPPSSDLGFRSKATSSLRVLGVFTGQGAQWPAMGRELILKSKLFNQTFEDLEGYLNELPDLPAWSLKKEIIASNAESRLKEGQLSQPLCTAIQIALVDLLASCGVKFHTVLGHSSGEIAAAYAAGFISAKDAMYIAYYRGVHSRLSKGLSGEQGAMIAVGLCLNDASEICTKSQFKSRVKVAASNSSSSTTLSGDEDAIREVKQFLEAKGIFTQVLQVDTAYHSHHMNPCAEVYLSSLQACKIRVTEPENDCTWVSSVYGLRGSPNPEELTGTYWCDNMVQPVLFSQAMERAINQSDPFDCVLEVGPHAALKGPACQTIKELSETVPPYSGLLDRKKNDIAAFGDALGMLWTRFGPSAVDFEKFASTFDDDQVRKPRLLKGLPGYSWEHSQLHWRESRISKQFRTRSDPPHELLGTRTGDDTEYEPRWRNILRLDEISWLSDHRFQGQVVVPGAVYCVMALEASKAFTRGKEVQEVELRNVEIQRAISLSDGSQGMETLFSLKRINDRKIERHGGGEIISGQFSISAAPVEGSNTKMRKICSGEVRVLVGNEPSKPVFGQIMSISDMNPMDIDQFYKSMLGINLEYTGAFRGLISAERRFNVASATVERLEPNSGLPVHPTWLDVCFQTLFAAFASPGDTTLWTTFLPTSIGKMTFTPAALKGPGASHSTLHVNTYVTDFAHATATRSPTITGDMRILDDVTGMMHVQVESLTMGSFEVAKESEDRELYLMNVWAPALMKGTMVQSAMKRSPQELAIVWSLERVVYYYLRKLKTYDFPKNSPPNLRALLDLTDSAEATNADWRMQTKCNSWNKDSRDDINHLIHRYSHQIDIQIVKMVGENLLSTVRGKSTMHERSTINSLISRLFKEGVGFPISVQQLASAARQIAHRYPRMHILEIGAGPPSAAKDVLEALGSSFKSYTLTDSSPIVVEEAKNAFQSDGKVKCKMLSLDEDILQQGFSEGFYDLVIASNSLHTAANFAYTLRNIRRIMRPGGFLLLMEPTGELLNYNFIMCAHPNANANNSQDPKFAISPVQWDSLLRKHGFAGVDSVAYDCDDRIMHTSSVMITQAIDDQIHMLRHPLQVASTLELDSSSLLIIGGNSLATATILHELKSLMSHWQKDITIVESFESLDMMHYPAISTIICLEDLDSPIIQHMTARKLRNMQQAFTQARSILWITNGSRGDNPYHTAMVGLGRTIASESPHLRLQFLDIDTTERIEHVIIECFIRLLMADLPELKDDSRLWTTETEIVLENGKMLISRILPWKDANDRLNSMKRVVIKSTKVATAIIEIVPSCEMDKQAYIAIERPIKNHIVSSEDGVPIKLSHCTVYPMSFNEATRLHVCVASIVENGHMILALTPTNTSFATVPRSWLIPVSMATGQEASLLEAIARDLTIQAILEYIARPTAVIIYDLDRQLAAKVQILASDMGKRPIFFASTPQPKGNDNVDWIFTSQYTMKQTIQSLFPSTPTLFLDFAPREPNHTSHIGDCLPTLCSIRTFFQKDTAYPNGPIENLQSTLTLVLNDAVAARSSSANTSPTPIISAAALIAGTKLSSFFEIVDWSNSIVVPTIQEPIDASALFSAARTYLLVGLTGGLGKSLCRWMVENGARNLVVSSRTPRIDAQWKKELHQVGAQITIEPMDVTDKNDLMRVCNTVLSKMPPIAGVVNGAMVLSDGLFTDMTFSSFDNVLKPKIEGSNNLDEVFAHTALDFFIMLSSLSAVIGNPGQANYAAANSYMAGLAAQRRQRGLVATVLDVGMILGIGYIQRIGGAASSLVEASLRRQNYMPMAERDIHQMFAEAILVGRTDSELDPEIITGLQKLDVSATERPVWHANPRFSHHVVVSGIIEEHIPLGKAKSIQQELSVVTTREQASEILQRCFSAQLALMLQLPLDGINVKIPIIDLGIDSLVAVEIRSWFLKEVNEDMAVLKVLGGASVEDLCNEIVPRIALSNCEHSPMALSSVRGRNSLEKSTTTRSNASLSSAESDSGSSSSAEQVVTPVSDFSNQGIPLNGNDGKHQKIEKMSFGQARIWFPSVYLEDQLTYNCTTSYRLTGPLDMTRLGRALISVTKANESFRTSFFTDMSTGQAIQAVSDTLMFKLKTIDPANESGDIKEEFRNISTHTYDLGRGDSFVATLLRHSPESHTIIFGYHHIIMDGVSWQLFLQNVEKYYSTSGLNLPPPSQYIDFALKQRNAVESGGLDTERAYWISEFSDLPKPLPPFPFAKTGSRKQLTRYDTRDIVVHLNAPLVSRIKRASRQAKTTTFHFYVAVLQVLIYRFTGVKDLCIGIADSSRTDQSFMDTIGFLLNFLPLKFHINGAQDFAEALKNTRTKVYAALGNSAVPFDTIVQDLKIETSTIDTPLFQVLVNYRMGALKQSSIGATKLDFLAYEDAKNPFDFALSIDEKEDGTGMLTLSMLSYLYDAEGGDMIMDTYLHLLEELSADISISVADIGLYKNSTIQKAVDLGTGPNLLSDWPDTLSLRVDDLIRRHTGDIAVKDITGASLTYTQMSERINDIADALSSNGVIRGSFVALFCEQSKDVVCSLLAIMRLGAVYVPLDTRSSLERLVSVIQDCQPKVIIFHNLTWDRATEFDKYAEILLNISSIPSGVKTRIANSSRGSDPAFLLFTSGSTGKPKGILLTNSNYVTHVAAASKRMKLGKEVVLQQSALGFDASLAQIFYALANGGTIIMANNRGDPADITKLMLKEQVTFTLCVPSEYSVLLQYGRASLEDCHKWRVAMCGGEVFNPNLKAKFRSLSLANLGVYNAYGPSEISVACSIGEVHYHIETSTEHEKVPIGHPLPNYGVHILDENSKTVPVGWPGEICISGPAVASGYFRTDTLTAAKFVQTGTNNRSQKSIDGWNTVYHTGDRGRLLSHGEVVFLGRLDGGSQIKLRGIRIELGDISSAILEASQCTLSDAVVGIRGGDEQFLAAYVVFAKEKTPDTTSKYLRQLLQSLPLPSYMRPAVAVPLKFLPMTASGKLDTKTLESLPIPHGLESEEELNALETQVKTVWERVLSGVRDSLQISKTSDFFSVGGNSLLLLRLQVEIRATFNVDVPLSTLFQINTLESLAERIAGNKSIHYHRAIDWDLESSIPSGLPTQIHHPQPGTKSKERISVLITGSTGFLGRTILQQLNDHDAVWRIRCVAIRQNPSAASRQPLISSEKIETHQGDLSMPLLGMSEEEAEEIFREVDVIIHNGADVSFMKKYESLRKANLESTKELARLALPRKTPIHYISTAGIAHLRGNDPLEEVSVATFPPSVDGSDGYVASKWASERFLEKMNEHCHLPVWIHRPASIIGEDAPSMDIMNNTLRFSRRMKAVPSMTGWSGYFDFIAVDSVATGIVEATLAPAHREYAGKAQPSYIHHSGETVIPISGLRDYLEKEEGRGYAVLSMNDWVKAATQLGLNELVGTFLTALADGGSVLNMPLLVKSRRSPQSVEAPITTFFSSIF